MATPTLVQHVSTSNTGAADAGIATCSGFDLWLPNPALSANCLILNFSYAGGQTVGTPTDDGGNTWTSVVSWNDGSGDGGQATLFVALNVAAGTRHITIPLSGTPTGFAGPWCQAICSEFYNIATSSAIDVHNSNINFNTASWTGGSSTPGTNGDLIWCAGVVDGNIGGITSWSAGSGFTLLSADILDGVGPGISQYQVQSTAAAINPAMTANGSGVTPQGGINWVALKSAAAGTAPPATGIRVMRMQYETLYNTQSSATSKFQFPCSGDTLAVVAGVTTGGGGSTTTASSISTTGPRAWIWPGLS